MHGSEDAGGARVTDGPGESAPDSLVIGSDLSELGRVGDWVNAWSRLHDVPVRTVERLDVCSTELVTNIITHAYAGSSAGQISLSLDCQGELLSLKIEDDAEAFDPGRAELPPLATSLEGARIGGLGLRIVLGLSDGLEHRRSGGRNQLTLIFLLTPT